MLDLDAPSCGPAQKDCAMSQRRKDQRRASFRRHAIGVLPLDVGGFAWFVSRRQREAEEAKAWADSALAFGLFGLL